MIDANTAQATGLAPARGIIIGAAASVVGFWLPVGYAITRLF